MAARLRFLLLPLAFLAGAACWHGGALRRPTTAAAVVADDSGQSLAPSILNAFDRLARLELWPGFEPGSTPLAIFDGDATWLARHPSPPQDFTPARNFVGVAVMAGRHPAVTANSSALIGGVETATLLADRDAEAEVQAATLIHETFHVFQRRHHPTWQANEVELLTYPFGDAKVLAARRLELAALARALAAATGAESACWSRAALSHREERYERIPAGAAAYERSTELFEGLAKYVELTARGISVSDGALQTSYPPEALRQRLYASGHVMAMLLDVLRPEWKVELGDGETLDELLASAAAVRAADRCSLPDAKSLELEREAIEDAHSFRERVERSHRDYLAREGWTLHVEASVNALAATGFDPLNVLVLDDSTVLHGRYLRLEHASGNIELVGQASLTRAAGPHPLFAGVRALVVTGLMHDPVKVSGDTLVTFSGAAIQGEWRGAQVERGERLVRVVLP